MSPAYNRLRRFAAVLIGLVFLVSGLLKLMDPVGTGLIVTEYVRFLHLRFLEPAAKVLGAVLSLVETITGFALIKGVFRKLFAWVATVMIVGFTFLTLALLIVNPAMDCGCFGQAVHLTHLQSFLKNVALLLLAVLAFVPFRDYGKPRRSCHVAFWLAVPTFFLLLFYNNRHLPVVDVMAFAPGARLFAAEDTEEEAAGEAFQTGLLYEKDGRTASFTLDRLPDSTWTFVGLDTLSRVLPKRPERPVLSFTDQEGIYRDSLAVRGKVVILSVYSPDEADWDRLSDHYQRIREAGAMPLVLLNASSANLSAYPLPAYSCDYKTLLTLNRGNGGGSYLDQGEVIAKWSPSDFPESLSGVLQADPVDVFTSLTARRRIKAQGYVLYLAALLLLV